MAAPINTGKEGGNPPPTFAALAALWQVQVDAMSVLPPDMADAEANALGAATYVATEARLRAAPIRSVDDVRAAGDLLAENGKRALADTTVAAIARALADHQPGGDPLGLDLAALDIDALARWQEALAATGEFLLGADSISPLVDTLREGVLTAASRAAEELQRRQPDDKAERDTRARCLLAWFAYCGTDAAGLASLAADLAGQHAAGPVTKAEAEILAMLRDMPDGHRSMAVDHWQGLPQDGGAERWSVSVYDKARWRGRGQTLAAALANRKIRTGK
jgi:hypothetical protein